MNGHTRRDRSYSELRYYIGITAFLLAVVSGCRADDELAECLDRSTIKGGLCAVIGSADDALAVALSKDRGFLVNCFSADPAKVTGARARLLAQNMYGLATVEELRGDRLPYADNLVSLIIVMDAKLCAEFECLRTLRPGGELLIRNAGGFRSVIKPRPADMDEWGQWRHAADHNPVSKDTIVDVPRRIQWLSLQGKDGKDTKEMVSANGRNFYLVGRNIQARDAFNGLPLWETPIDAKSAAAVAAGSNLFLVSKTELKRIDASTGKVKRTYSDAATPNTVLHVDNPQDPEGVLITADAKTVRCVAVGTGRLLWSHAAEIPRGVSVGEGGVYFVSGDPKSNAAASIVGLELSTGSKRWEITDLPWAKTCYRCCVGNGMVIFETGRFAVPYSIIGEKNAFTGIHFVDAKTGKVAKDYEYKPAMRHDENARAFIVGDKVAVHRLEKDKAANSLVLFGRDLDKEPDVFPAAPPNKQDFYCYPPVATERFFIFGQMSFTDWQSHENRVNQITRGSCGYWSEGMIPANGLMYIFAKTCGCFSMLSGVGALAPGYARPVAESTELIKGSAFGQAPSIASGAGDWPIYRGNDYRTGSTPRPLPTQFKQLWSTDIPQPVAGLFKEEWKDYPFSAGVLTPPVIANGLVCLAQPHTHRVFAFDAESGKQKWAFTANGRVDSAPTIFDGLCLFGTRMGWVYCLRASDGALVWSLRAAPDELRIVHCGQVESPWPVQGSILVSGGMAYFSAGMHPLADGGLRAFAVNPKTGEIKWKRPLADMGYNQHGWHMRAGLEQDYVDLFVKDGDKIAMSRWEFETENGVNEFLWHNAYYRVGKDGPYMQRGTWSYGYPMNRPRMHRPLLVCNETSVLGANRVRESKDAPPDIGAVGALKLFRRDFKPGEKFNTIWDEQPNDTASRIGQYFPVNRIAEEVTWAAPYPGWIEAMVMADDKLYFVVKGKLSVQSAVEGKAITSMDIAPPVWDGIAPANGRLYVSTQDSRIICLGAK